MALYGGNVHGDKPNQASHLAGIKKLRYIRMYYFSPHSFQLISLNTLFKTFQLADSGIPSTNTTPPFSHLYFANLPCIHLFASSPVTPPLAPTCLTTYALTTSPSPSHITTTATSRTPGHPPMTPSAFAGATCHPLTSSNFFLLSTVYHFPDLSYRIQTAQKVTHTALSSYSG